jgi:hypothetical protein
MNKKNLYSYLIPILFGFYFVIGLFIHRNYGIGIEEHFQRQNGFYWLEKIFASIRAEEFHNLALDKYLTIKSYNPNLPNPDFFNFYGIAFDVPAAFIELFFEFNNSKQYFEIRHLMSFFFFFISSIFFYKILKKRFKNDFIIFLGTVLYIINPRIFGDSFHNNKDIFFLSILTISIFFLFKYFEKQNIKSIIFFCLFAAIATSTRIVGIYLPILLGIFIFIEYLSNKKTLNVLIKTILQVTFFFIVFLYSHFPYMWELNILQFTSWFKVFFYNMGLSILFNGDYYHIKYLPHLYLPLWIFITTPILVLFLFVTGFILLFKRFFNRILNINLSVSPFCDLWRSTNEKKDLFIFTSLTSFMAFAVFLNVAMLSGWRHFYFLHFFIIYIVVFSLHLIFIFLKKNRINNTFFKIINLFFIFFILKDIILFHPYQSLYFNSFINKKNNVDFPVDTPSLSRAEALRFIIQHNRASSKIFVANASWTPLYNGKDLLSEVDQSRLFFVGQEYNKADYIYTNFNYEVDPKFNKKYNISKQFKEIKNMSIKGIPIYSIYERVK